MYGQPVQQWNFQVTLHKLQHTDKNKAILIYSWAACITHESVTLITYKHTQNKSTFIERQPVPNINSQVTLNPCPAEPGYTLPLQTV